MQNTLSARWSKHTRKRMLGDWAFILPQLTLYVGLTLLPFVIALPLLFTNKIDFQHLNPQYVGFDNFTRIFTDPAISNEYWSSVWRTTVFTLLNYTTVYVFGLVLALVIYEIGFQSGFFTIIYLPMMASALAVGYIADMLFSQSTGTVNMGLAALGSKLVLDIKMPSGTMIILPILTGWRWAGFNMALFLAGLLTIPTETVEAAIVDGASYWQRLWRIYFPQMIPSFIIATIFCIIGSFGIFDEAIALGAMTGNRNARFLAILFFQYAFQGQKLALSMTMALQTFFPLVILAVFLQKVQQRAQYE